MSLRIQEKNVNHKTSVFYQFALPWSMDRPRLN